MRAVFDLILPLERAAEGYAATDKRRATKVMLTVWFRRPTAASWLPAANADIGIRVRAVTGRTASLTGQPHHRAGHPVFAPRKTDHERQHESGLLHPLVASIAFGAPDSADASSRMGVWQH